MSKADSPINKEAQAEVAALFDNSPLVLVEVRFPSAATSPDWHLCADEEQLEHLLDSLRPGAELYLSSVWHLKNVKKEVRLRKQ